MSTKRVNSNTATIRAAYTVGNRAPLGFGLAVDEPYHGGV